MNELNEMRNNDWLGHFLAPLGRAMQTCSFITNNRNIGMNWLYFENIDFKVHISVVLKRSVVFFV